MAKLCRLVFKLGRAAFDDLELLLLLLVLLLLQFD